MLAKALAGETRGPVINLEVSTDLLKACSKTGFLASASESPGANVEITPTRRIRSGCCARAASGQPATAPPMKVRNSRRFIESPRGRPVGPEIEVGAVGA